MKHKIYSPTGVVMPTTTQSYIVVLGPEPKDKVYTLVSMISTYIKTK